MAIDVAKVRSDTPAAQELAFLDNAGAALSPTIVTSTVIEYLEREQQIGGYAAMEEAEDRILAVNASAARLVGVDADQVALQTSATSAWMRAFTSVPLVAGDRILTTRAEYASNVLPMIQAAQRAGATIEFIADGADGTADPNALADMLDERVKVVAITHAPSHNGLIVDAAAIGDVIRAADSAAWYLLDACQSLGQIPVDMGEIGADFFTATGRKFLRGPRGTGFLAVSKRVLAELEPFPINMFGSDWDGDVGYKVGPSANRFQSFETSLAGMLGLGAAIDYTLDVGLDEIRVRLDSLANQLRSELSTLDGVRVFDRGDSKSAIVVFSCSGNDAWEAVRRLRDVGVIVTAVKRQVNPRDIDSYGAECVLRASPHIYNTEADLNDLVRALGATH